jgi:L-rhamnonate dehydratase
MRDRIVSVRAWTVSGSGGDYHDQASGHWIDDHVASPMSRYPQYRERRSSFGINALGSFVVEVESDSGEVGVGVSTGGVPACWIVENRLSRFVEGRRADDVELIWDQMFNSTLYYGRKGLVLNVISAVDLAIWDLRAKLRQEPVFALLGGPVRNELEFYATGSRPDLAKEMGFIGGKMPLLHGPAEGEEGFRKNVERAERMRSAVGEGFWLMYYC